MELNIKAVCFDYYMTLVQLEQPFEQIKKWIEQHLKKNNCNIELNRFHRKFTRNRAVLSTDGVFRLGIKLLMECMKLTCKEFDYKYCKDEFKSFIDELFSSPLAYKDAHEVINQLKKYYKVGLVTNADNYIINESILRQSFGFDFVVTSEDAQCNKPHKNIFKYTMKKLDATHEDIIMIGDSQVDDIYGASQMGIKTIWLNRKKDIVKKELGIPNFEVNSLNEIIKILI